jgi:hypothetical protein
LSLSSLYHHASSDSTFASITIDAAAASSAATDPSDKLTQDELTILSLDGGELKEIMSVGGNPLRGIITTTQACAAMGESCKFKFCCGDPRMPCKMKYYQDPKDGIWYYNKTFG